MKYQNRAQLKKSEVGDIGQKCRSQNGSNGQQYKQDALTLRPCTQ